MTDNPLIHTLLATNPLPPPLPVMYERILAGNGLFLRAQRDQLRVLFPIETGTVPELPLLTPEIAPTVPLIPKHLMDTLWNEAQQAWRSPEGPLESLFHFTYTTDWQLAIPEQVRTAVSVHPKDLDHCPSYATCLVEIHSHHEMSAKFSQMDNADETGFRIYGVCGNFNHHPHITFRVGLYGHYYPIPASLIVELPPQITDSYTLRRPEQRTHQ